MVTGLLGVINLKSLNLNLINQIAVNRDVPLGRFLINRGRFLLNPTRIRTVTKVQEPTVRDSKVAPEIGLCVK